MRLVVVGIVAAIVFSGGRLVKADFTFGKPAKVPIVNTSYRECDPSLSSDGLQLYFNSPRGGGSGGFDLWVAKRASTDEDWEQPENLGPTVNDATHDHDPSISADGLALYFCSDNRSGGMGNGDLWSTRRVTINDPWETPVNLGSSANSPNDDMDPCPSANGQELYFCSNRPGGYGNYDIWVTTQQTSRQLSCDLWMTTRPTVDDNWGEPVNLGPNVNSSAWEDDPAISYDGLWIFYNFDVGSENIWQVPILPIVDFNGDGRVDGFEFAKLADYWGKYEPSCDIGPTPLGDGLVDVEDLIVLSEYIGKDVNDPSLMAHWALDEIEGNIAYDSAGENHATVMGDAVWLPIDGIVNGALLLDGNNSCCVTESVYDPSEGPLSVFVWIQGGAPGQVIVSQVAGVSWLMADEESATSGLGCRDYRRWLAPCRRCMGRYQSQLICRRRDGSHRQPIQAGGLRWWFAPRL
jgi:hypothetical protein